MRLNPRWTSSLAVILSLAGPPVLGGATSELSPVFLLGDRWAVIGDSITHAGAYQSFIYLYFLTRYPARPLKVANCGVSGDIVPGALARYNWDVEPFQPTVATVMLGMNDLGRPMFMPTGPIDDIIKAKNREQYQRDMAALLDRLESKGVRAVVLSPTAYDATTRNDKMPPVPGINAELRAGTEIDRQLAQTHHLAFVDLFNPLLNLTLEGQRTNPAFTLTSPERVHPLVSGHFAMATEFLVQLHCNPVVATISVPAGSEADPLVVNCQVTNVHRERGGVDFDCLEAALPFPVPADVAAMAVQLHFFSRLNRETLMVPGLAGSTYALAIDRLPVAQFTASQLASGVNLAEFDSTPQARQAARVGALEQQRYDISVRLRILAEWRQVMESNDIPFDRSASSDQKMEAILAAWKREGRPYADIFAKLNIEFKDTRTREPELRRQLDDLNQEEWAVARPTVHHFSLTVIAQ